jgi:hypothetical protein
MSVFSAAGPLTPEQADAYIAAVLGLLGERDPVEVLRETLTALPDALAGLSPDRAVQPEAPGKWSVRHVVRHLADSELVTGFRLRLVLAHDRPPLAPYDQDRLASALRYGEARLEDALEEFLSLRRGNLRHWEHLAPAELARVGLHGERGEESLDRMRRLTAGHDLLHLRQIARIRRAVEPAAE